MILAKTLRFFSFRLRREGIGFAFLKVTMKKQNFSRRIVKRFLLLAALTFIGQLSFARPSKKPASVSAKNRIEKVPFENFYGKYQISACESSGQITTDYCNYKYLIVSKVGVIGPDGLPAEAVKFRYMTLKDAGEYLDNSVALFKTLKGISYVDGKDSSEYRQSVVDSSGHTLETEISFSKNSDASFQLKNKSGDVPQQGDGFVGEAILTLKKL
jgi:hypothetical protein